MTTAKKSVRAPMELDLDSLLRAHGGHLSSSDDEDGGESAFLHRTVDEILNDSDSSSDSSPSLPRPPIFTPKEQVFPSSSSSARALPPLFGSVRPNAKPGAALAAAAAASRAIPTPHAAAIKNRRASSTGSIQKVESSGDLQEMGDLSEVIATFAVNDEGQVENSAAISQSSSSVEVEATVDAEEAVREEVSEGAEEPCTVEAVETSHQPVEVKEENSEDNLVDMNSLAATAAYIYEDVHQGDDALLLQDAVVSVADHVDGIDNQEVGLEVLNDELGYDSGKSDQKTAYDGESGRGSGEGGDMGDEIDKLVEERLEQLENSKKAEEKVEKKLRASMKPLEWAEELEKRHASYGLHWEEGAAAQPMRLKGIRRGPPAVGYLQIDLDNAVSRAISSQTFRRDYGSPQVMAVHTNFIAIGMSKGVVLVFPSKYSAHSPDHMDSKILNLNLKWLTPAGEARQLMYTGRSSGCPMIHDCKKTRAQKGAVGLVAFEEEVDEERSAGGSYLDGCVSGGEGEKELLSMMKTRNGGVIDQIKKVARLVAGQGRVNQGFEGDNRGDHEGRRWDCCG